jgi:SAM-dependent methyltransferase
MTHFQNPLSTWDKRFEGDGFLFGEQPNTYLLSQQNNLMSGNALAIADGEGRNGVWLAGQGLHVDAFDFSQNALAKAKALATRKGVQLNLHCTDWQSFDWQSLHYDNIVGIFFQFADAHDRAEIFKRIDQALKPGGVLIIQGYTPAQLKFNTGGPGKLDHLYTETMLREAFANYQVLDARTYEAEIAEGTAHVGMSGLLGFTAKKPL